MKEISSFFTARSGSAHRDSSVWSENKEAGEVLAGSWGWRCRRLQLHSPQKVMEEREGGEGAGKYLFSVSCSEQDGGWGEGIRHLLKVCVINNL